MGGGGAEHRVVLRSAAALGVIKLIIICLSTCAVVGQFSKLYSTVRPIFVAKMFHDLYLPGLVSLPFLASESVKLLFLKLHIKSCKFKSSLLFYTVYRKVNKHSLQECRNKKNTNRN